MCSRTKCRLLGATQRSTSQSLPRFFCLGLARAIQRTRMSVRRRAMVSLSASTARRTLAAKTVPMARQSCARRVAQAAAVSAARGPLASNFAAMLRAAAVQARTSRRRAPAVAQGRDVVGAWALAADKGRLAAQPRSRSALINLRSLHAATKAAHAAPPLTRLRRTGTRRAARREQRAATRILTSTRLVWAAS